MAVYVDDVNIPYRRMIMCHMIADTDDELHNMAQHIGVQRKHWQSPDKHSTSHYDICREMKQKAILAGAIPITAKQAAAMTRRRRVEGILGNPNDAIQWYKNWRAFGKSI